ncbi:hypothetical protein GCM10022244_43520 [Streptomyces gulbargensis]|uniref:Uncharacterized protein n=1 Tax=Streptomyces gulbargensis TaxID=364901 RepID=A0ABP7MVN3_9ACTN
MGDSGTFEFFVLNLTKEPLKGTVSWNGAGRTVDMDVNGLEPCAVSQRAAFSPERGRDDMWSWSERGRQYQLNCYDGDRYVVVTISDYGIAVLPTKTSPYTWEW